MSRILKNTAIGGCAFTPIILIAYFAICWVVNLIKFIGCDFASPWKDELIHGIGVFTVLGSGITAWF